MNLDHQRLRDKLYSLLETQELSENDVMLILFSLNKQSLSDDRIQLMKKLENLRRMSKLEDHEFEYLEKKLSSSLIPLFSIISVIFGSFGLILLDSSSAALASLFKFSEMSAVVGVICGAIALSRRESPKSISIIGFLLSLLVLLIDNTILFGI